MTVIYSIPSTAGIMDDLKNTQEMNNFMIEGKLEEAAEIFLKIEDPSMKEISAISLQSQFLIRGEVSRGELFLKYILNENIRQVSYQSLATQFMLVTKDCIKAKQYIDLLLDSQIRELSQISYNMACPEVLQPLEIDKILKLIDSISSQVSIVDWSEQDASSVLTKLENLNSELGNITSSIEGINQKSVVASDEDYNLVCVSKDNDGLSPYSITLRNGPVEEKRFLVSYQTIDECKSAIEIREAVEGSTYICAPKDNDGLAPFEILIVDFGNSHSRYIKTNAILGTKKNCDQALNAKVLSKGSDHVCASKDADGLNPFGLFRLERNANSQLVGGVFSGFEECLGSL